VRYREADLEAWVAARVVNSTSEVRAMTDYGDLSTTELAKQINDEYAVILASERTQSPEGSWRW
jgi:hypothetical protein